MTGTAGEPAAAGAGPPAGGAGGPLADLLALQDVDTAIDQLRHRRATAPERARLAEAEAAAAGLQARRHGLQSRRQELGDAQAALEVQIEAGRSRRRQIDDRMRSGQVTAARDLTAMAEEMDHLAAHVSGLEDRELEVMEALEPIDAELAEVDADLAARAGEIAEHRRAVAAMEEEVDTQLAGAERQRADRAAALEPALLAQYERIRARAGGVGAARLVGSTCTGCHLEVPSMEVDRLRKAPPGTVMTCEQCGRILVP